MDITNQVIQLCIEGMKAEGRDDPQQALKCFMQAWDIHEDEYEACISAHYIARHQSNLYDALHWNQLALNYAKSINDTRVKDFFPSLYLHLGKSYEDLGNTDTAKKYYKLANDNLDDISGESYKKLIHRGIVFAQKRVN